jgi:DNA-binding IclR family transcriptional regulator
VSRSSERSLELLAEAVRAARPASLTELAQRTGVDTSTAARLLEQLERGEWLQRDAIDKRFRMGPLFVQLAARALERPDLKAVAAPHLRRLRDASEETVTLHVRAGAQRVCVDGAESPHAIRRAALLGEVVPLHEGVTGRAILAFLEDRDMAAPMRAMVSAAASETALRRALGRVRRHGYSSGIGERATGVGVLAVPVFDATGVIAAISIGGPDKRWSLARIRAFAPAALHAASEISQALGFRSSAS